MNGAASMAIPPRSRIRALLLCVAGAFAADTIAWIGAALTNSGDVFAVGNVQLVAVFLGANIFGAFAAVKIRSKGLVILLAIVDLLCLLFWVAVPNGWWVSPPPPAPSATDGALP